MFRTALLILSGNATASFLLLVRNLVVARLIPVEDYGIAATFGVVMAMVEMASTFGLQQQIVQSKEGDDPHFQAALQGFQVFRGLAAGIVLFMIADPIARFLGIPQVVWAYQLLALVPVIRAFEHFDIHRFNRQMRFWPMILTGTVPALLSLLLIWPLASWLEDWRVLLYAILAQVGLTMLVSHLVAERSYRLALDRGIMGSSLRFGWPILANAVLLYFVFQGDKIIVGRVLGMEALAIFAMGMTLTLTPTMILAKSAQNFFLPVLSNLHRNTVTGEARFQHIAMLATEIHILFGAGFVCLVVIFGEMIVNLLLGEKFNDLIGIFTLFAILQCFRILKGGSSSISTADGRTENMMIANAVRVLLLPLGYVVAMHTESVNYVLLVAIIGEFIGFLVSVLLIWQRCNINPRPFILPGIGAVLICITSYCGEVIMPQFMLFAVIAILLMLTTFMMKGITSYLRGRLGQ